MENLKKYWPVLVAALIVLLGFGACWLFVWYNAKSVTTEEERVRKESREIVDSVHKAISEIDRRLKEANKTNAIYALRKDSIENEIKIIQKKQHETRDHYQKLIDSVGRFTDDDIERYFSNRPAGKAK